MIRAGIHWMRPPGMSDGLAMRYRFAILAGAVAMMGGQVVGRLTAVGRGLAAIGLISEERN